ncbi:PAS domain S-box protein [Zavarzinella formosa]|uniref:PAS domain S-box protein n=1 Tax=Zavarzinella formosa TaxID=360055 RepID=UPI0002FB504C|nr:PAS domain S-box protein [Zavarzinella formosa]
MSDSSLRILVVEDNPADFRLVSHALRQAGIATPPSRVETEQDFLASLESPPDIILCDYSLPQFNAPRALKLLRDREPHLPFVIVSGSIGEDTAVEAMRMGATDYLLKDRLGRLGQAVRQAVEQHRLRQAEEQARAALADQAKAIAVRAAIATVVARTGDIRTILGDCCEALVRQVGVLFARVWTLNEAEQTLELQCSRGLYTHTDGPHARIPLGELKIGRIACSRQAALTNSVADDPEVSDRDWAKQEGVVGFAGYPLIVEDRLVGVLAMFSRSPIRREMFDHLAGVADLVAQLIERKRNEEALRAGELRYRELADAIPQIVWTATPDGALDHLNARSTQYTGLPLSELTGWNWGSVIHPDDLPQTVTGWMEIIQSGTPRMLEFRIRRADGEYRWHITRQVVSRGPDGKVVGWYGTSTDIHDQKVAEEALRASETRFRMLVDTLPHKMWITDANGMALYLNQRGLTQLRTTEEEIRGRGWLRFVHPDDKESVLEEWEASVRAGTPCRNEYRMQCPAGEYRWYLSQGVPLKGPDGRVDKWVGTWTDINEQKRAEELVRQSSELLHAVAESTTEAVFVKDREGRYLLFNPAAARFVGKPVGEVLGRTDDHIFEPASARSVMAKDRAIMESGIPNTSEEELTAAGITRTYLVTKAPHRNPAGEIIGLVGISRDVSDIKRAELELRLRDRAIQAVSQGILITDPNQPDNPIIYVSPSCERLTGYKSEEMLGRNCRFLQGRDTDRETVRAIRAAIDARRPVTTELLNYRKDGTPFWNNLAIAPVMDGDRLSHFIAVQTDVSDRRKMEDQFRQSQKMEAVGQLAGGVAHDFNNLLTIINGYSEILLDDPASDALRPTLLEIREAGERAAGLTAQLLAFSRKTIIEPKILDLNDVVDSIGKLLRRLIGEDIKFTTHLAARLHRIKADPGLVEQVIMNLAVNARDAMPGGGRLTIETKNTKLMAEELPNYPECLPGPYVRMAVSDTGTGMTDEVRAKIFEPFFTTKGVGKGTGLGLATVYGIIKQSGGHVAVFSEVGVGTRFELLFPAAPDAGAGQAETGPAPPTRGVETVLLVEDEDAVRKLSATALAFQGYKVLEAARGAEAIRIADQHAGVIHLLVTDVVMPEMGGRELADTLRTKRPELRVMYISGYTNDAVVRQGVSEATDAFLQKPFTPLTLARKVRALLDSGR